MNGQIIGCSEHLFTSIAFIGFLHRVKTDMSLQIAGCGEPPSTGIAFVGGLLPAGTDIGIHLLIENSEKLFSKIKIDQT